MKIVFMFSGQGSQYYQMGRNLFNTDPVFRKCICELDEIVKSVQGVSVVDEMYRPGYKLFDPFLSLKLTHPAIFMVEYATAKMLEKYNIRPDYLLGSSLGEFTTAALSGIINETEAIKLILKQAQIIEDSCEEGKLIAVLHHLGVYDSDPVLHTNSTLASINAPEQFVIAGESGKLNRIKNLMKEKSIFHQELMVSYGFHSPSIDPAKKEYTAYLESQSFREPSIPVISGMNGYALEKVQKNHFWEVVRNPINFVKAIDNLENTAGLKDELVYVDLGPSGSLANLIKYNISKTSGSIGFQIMSPFQQELKKLGELSDYCKINKKQVVYSPTSGNRKPIAYVFPGQGSQRKGMGNELFDTFPKLTDKASEILGYSLKELCLNDPNRKLNHTAYTQPALFVVNAMQYLKLKEETGTVPDFVAGHSLGEYNALFAAGVLDFETGLKIVQKRGALMADIKDGGMVAVKGLNEEEIQEVIERHQLKDIDIANYNSQNQTVLSGPKDTIATSGHYFESAGATLYYILNVSGAFHSRYMVPAKEEFQLFLQQFDLSPQKIPVISNVEASFYQDNRVIELLSNQLIKPVRWTETINFLLEHKEITFKEVGPGDVLTKLIWGIQNDSRVAIP